MTCNHTDAEQTPQGKECTTCWMAAELQRAQRAAPITKGEDWAGRIGTADRIFRAAMDQRRSWISEYAHNIRPRLWTLPEADRKLTLASFRRVLHGVTRSDPRNGLLTGMQQAAREIKISAEA